MFPENMDKTHFSTIILRNTLKLFELNLIKSVGPQKAKQWK